MRTVSYIFMLFLLIKCSESEDTKNIDEQNEQEKYNLSLVKNGDIILKRGKGMISEMIVKTLKEDIPISHCAVIIKNRDSTYVVHSVAREVSGIDGIQKLPLSDFLHDTEKGSLYVLRHKSEQNKRDQLAKQALRYLSLRIPFDYDFNHKDTTTMYCSELVNKVLVDVYNEQYFTEEVRPKGTLLQFNGIINSGAFDKIPVSQSPETESE